jgi:DNA-binding MarR family transcriptional regulator
MFEHKRIDFKELSRIVDLKTGTLTPILQKLEAIGYISKVKHENDNRRVDILLTEEGTNLKEKIVEVPIGMGTQLEITESMYNTLVKELDELSMILKNAAIKEEK